ncbi:MAG: leucine-rich repeat protein [Clostridia bacterium]|nr:leucine-rich repeat protein [Clostridia bacterium]
MAIFKCKMCAEPLPIASSTNGVCTCSYCGTQQTVSRLLNERLEGLYGSANHHRRNNEFDIAISVYQQILAESPEDSEAYFGIVLCRYGIEYVKSTDKKSAGKMLPTMHRTQSVSVFDDDDFKLACEYATPEQKSIYQKQAKEIDRIQGEILKLSISKEPYDVFICYKETDKGGSRTEDSLIGYNLFKELTRDGLTVFYARETLKDRLGSEYEPYIFSALNSAKVMLVICTKAEYINATWVKNEWKRFLDIKNKGKAVSIFPVYKGIKPSALPKEFKLIQGQSLDEVGGFENIVSVTERIVGKAPTTPPPTIAPTITPTVSAVKTVKTDSAPQKVKAPVITKPTIDENGVLRFPEGTTSIRAKAFQGNNSIKEIILPEGLKKIGDSAFYECSSVESVFIPNTVTEIHEYAFSACKKLRKVSAPGHLAHKFSALVEELYITGNGNLKETTAYNGQNLKKLSISPEITTIAFNHFKCLNYLTEISAHPSVIELLFSHNDMRNVKAISFVGKGEIERPWKISTRDYSIEYLEFGNDISCSNSSTEFLEKLLTYHLKSLVLPSHLLSAIGKLIRVLAIETLKITGDGILPRIPFSVSSISLKLLLEGNFHSIEAHAFENMPISELTLPSSISQIGEGAFAGTQLNKIILPNDIKVISKDAFKHCLKLKSVTFPKSLRTIKSCAFEECGLETVTIPDSVEAIESGAFDNCTRLHTFILQKAPRHIGGSIAWSHRHDHLKNLVCPASCLSSFDHDGLEYLKILGEGKLETNALKYAEFLETVIIEKGVSKVCSFAFGEAERSKLTIYCEAKPFPLLFQPLGWDSNWKPIGSKVIWNCNKYFAKNGEPSMAYIPD